MSTIKDYLAAMKETFDLEKKTVEQVREVFSAQAKQEKLTTDTVVEKVIIANLPAEWVRAP